MQTAKINIRDTFIKNMTRIRKANKLTQHQLGDRLNIARGRIGDWEAFVCFPPIEVIVKVCDHFEIDVRRMLTEEITAEQLDQEG